MLGGLFKSRSLAGLRKAATEVERPAHLGRLEITFMQSTDEEMMNKECESGEILGSIDVSVDNGWRAARPNAATLSGSSSRSG